MAEIVPVVSEALEAQVRSLLPSQRGFGEDLQASNVIMPIIDLTAAAEGSTTPEFLQRAWDFSTGNFNSQAAATTTIINTTGFWQIDLTVSLIPTVTGATGSRASLLINDGATTTRVWDTNKLINSATGNGTIAESVFIVFLRAGDSLEYTNNSSVFAHFSVWYRQVADVNGNLTNPLGFTPQ